MALSPEAKAALLARLKSGREKTKKAREDAKAAGKPDPKPRKMRKDKKGAVDTKEALADPLALPADRENKVQPISGAKPDAVNVVAATPPAPSPNDTSLIDVPNLPGKGKKVGKDMIVDNPEKKPELSGPKDLSTTGKPKKINKNNLIVNEETGSSVISNQMPGQKESIKKLLKKDKTELNPETPAPVANPPEKTVKNVIRHVPDTKAIEARAPFSFSAVRKLLYQ